MQEDPNPHPDEVELTLPFEGFYQTVHELALDGAAEAAGVSSDDVDWPMVRLGYAQAYMRELSRLTGIGMAFSRVSAPEFYNFETDVILVRVRAGEVEHLHAGIMADPERAASLRDRVREELTARAGFAPYFSSDLDDWGPVTGWGPAQMSLLLDHAFMRSGLDEAVIAETLAERTLELVQGAPRSAAYTPPGRDEEPSP